MPHLPTPGKVHVGFATVASSLWPSVRSALHDLVEHSSTGVTIKHVNVAGHSLGAGVATLISFAAQVRDRSAQAVHKHTPLVNLGFAQTHADATLCAHCRNCCAAAAAVATAIAEPAELPGVKNQGRRLALCASQRGTVTVSLPPPLARGSTRAASPSCTTSSLRCPAPPP